MKVSEKVPEFSKETGVENENVNNEFFFGREREREGGRKEEREEMCIETL